MKQHITVKQLNELSEKGKSRLLKFVRKTDWEDYYCECGPSNHERWRNTYLPLLSIGQMVEFLDENKKRTRVWAIYSAWRIGKKGGGDVECICDALWEAVKEVLGH